ncbi:serine hydrolase [Brevundimonas sp. LM2]|nr:serine hydrolase [Brevundimonas sp. LM2]
MLDWLILPLALLATTAQGQTVDPPLLTVAEAIDARIEAAMTTTRAKGLALAVIDDGQIVYITARGVRNPARDPLTTDTVMYGASLTKAVYAYTVMQLVDEGVVDLDRPMAEDLAQPLTDYYSEDLANRYADWRALDPRWRHITHRMSLTHSTGFPNFGFLEPDGKERIHFDPGSRYAYSGDGFILSQFVLEKGRAGLEIGAETQRRVFDRFGMPNSSLIWRPDFANNLADGWDEAGAVEPHDERSKVRAAGSMDTTIADFARFAAGFMRGEGLSPAAREEIVRPQLAITTATQFPSLQVELAPSLRRPDLAAGLGVVTFVGPQGRGFYKGGHNGTTANTWVCVEASGRCVIILSNDVRSEPAFAELVGFVLGETGVPFEWEYGTTPPSPP